MLSTVRILSPNQCLLIHGYGRGEATSQEGNSQLLPGLRGGCSVQAWATVPTRWPTDHCCFARGRDVCLCPASLAVLFSFSFGFLAAASPAVRALRPQGSRWQLQGRWRNKEQGLSRLLVGTGHLINLSDKIQETTETSKCLKQHVCC